MKSLDIDKHIINQNANQEQKAESESLIKAYQQKNSHGIKKSDTEMAI